MSNDEDNDNKYANANMQHCKCNKTSSKSLQKASHGGRKKEEEYLRQAALR